MAPKLIVALDVESRAKAEDAARALKGKADLLKVGLQLFTAEGPEAVRAVAEHGPVFLDLKLHDIPNTVQAAVREAGKLGVYALSIHLSGGPEMLKAAAAVSPRPKLWGITLLTSLPDLSHVGSGESAKESVARLARLAKACGLEGVVCSGEELEQVKALGLEAVVPGVRPAGGAAHDQHRTITPADAARKGADFVVVGRPIMDAPDRAAAADALRKELHAR